MSGAAGAGRQSEAAGHAHEPHRKVPNAHRFSRPRILRVGCIPWLTVYSNHLPGLHLPERALESRYQWQEHFNLLAVRDQRNDAQPQAGEVLLLLKAPVDRNEHIKPRRSQFEKLAVLFARPAHSANRPNVVAGQRRLDLNGNTLIQQDAHLRAALPWLGPKRPAPAFD